MLEIPHKKMKENFKFCVKNIYLDGICSSKQVNE
jgi:hypothetical protein